MAKILVMDDNQAPLDAARNILEEMGHTVETAAGFEAAKQMLIGAKPAFEIVLADTYQSIAGSPPNPMGLRLGQWMQENAYPAKMILQSGFMESHFRDDNIYKMLKKAGVISGFINKPYEFAKMEEVVATSLTPKEAPLATILLVEADELLLKTIKGILERAGYKVIPATSGTQGFEQYKNNPSIDMIITDCDMEKPAEGGMAAGIKLVSDIRRTRSVQPILMISGGAESAKRALLSSLPGGDKNLFLAKPFKMQEFLGHVATQLAGPVRGF